MRDYAKVAPSFWTRGSGKRLRGDVHAQLVALYLVTCPNANMVGVFYVPLVTIAHETGLSVEAARAALDRLSLADFAHYDHECDLAWVPNAASYQLGDGLEIKDKRRAGVIREVSAFGQHRFVREFFLRYAAPYQLPVPAWVRSPLQAPSDDAGSPSQGAQNQYQEQYQEQSSGSPSVSEPAAPLTFPTPEGLDGAEAAIWARGVARATGKPCTQPSWSDGAQIAKAMKAHAPGMSGPAAETWLEESAFAFASTENPKFGGFTVRRWVTWENSGRPGYEPASGVMPISDPVPPRADPAEIRAAAEEASKVLEGLWARSGGSR